MKDRVLFVDDEPNVLDGIRRQLRNRVELETATSGSAGLEIIKRPRQWAATGSASSELVQLCSTDEA